MKHFKQYLHVFIYDILYHELSMKTFAEINYGP